MRDIQIDFLVEWNLMESNGKLSYKIVLLSTLLNARVFYFSRVCRHDAK